MPVNKYSSLPKKVKIPKASLPAKVGDKYLNRSIYIPKSDKTYSGQIRFGEKGGKRVMFVSPATADKIPGFKNMMTGRLEEGGQAYPLYRIGGEATKKVAPKATKKKTVKRKSKTMEDLKKKAQKIPEAGYGYFGSN